MYNELWKPKEYYNPNDPIGSINNPADSNPHNTFLPFYQREENMLHNYIAVYLGYTKRFVMAYDYVHGKELNNLDLLNRWWYFSWIYKKSHETFDFNDHSWYSYMDLLTEMKEKGDYDQNIQAALLTLDKTIIRDAIFNKLKAIGIKPDLSLDWKTGTKWEGK